MNLVGFPDVFSLSDLVLLHLTLKRLKVIWSQGNLLSNVNGSRGLSEADI